MTDAQIITVAISLCGLAFWLAVLLTYRCNRRQRDIRERMLKERIRKVATPEDVARILEN
jgi:hypothetical protein